MRSVVREPKTGFKNKLCHSFFKNEIDDASRFTSFNSKTTIEITILIMT